MRYEISNILYAHDHHSIICVRDMYNTGNVIAKRLNAVRDGENIFREYRKPRERGCFFKETRLKIDYRVRSIRYQILQV